jgi:hydroxymethylpyrimidine pyrophosphatase-like HAD family hydrolase
MSSDPDAPAPPPVRLLALDLDGTLLRRDGTVTPADRAAIAAAQARGVVVTLATGRLSSSTMPVAEALGLDAPLVCADGAVLFCPKTVLPLHQVPLGVEAVGAMLGTLHRRSLAGFWFTHEAVCGSEEEIARFPFVSGWTPRFSPHQNHGAPLAPLAGLPPITAIGVGPEVAIQAALAELRADPAVTGELTVFNIRTTDHWVVRLTPSDCTKALGLEQMARDLAIAPAEVLALGDWYNDIPMLEWAGRSFAMGHAPPEVQRAAKGVVEATVDTGGGVAEALARVWGRPAVVA